MNFTTNCDGSGRKRCCATEVPHKHCTGPTQEVLVIRTDEEGRHYRSLIVVGGCLDVYFSEGEMCDLCREESRGVRIHADTHPRTIATTGEFRYRAEPVED